MSEIAVAALVADEESAEFVVDDGEEFGSAGTDSAADAAFAWLAAERSVADCGGWNTAAATGELLVFNQAERSLHSASSTAPSQLTTGHLQRADDAGEPHWPLEAKRRRAGAGQSAIADEIETGETAAGLRRTQSAIASADGLGTSRWPTV